MSVEDYSLKLILLYKYNPLFVSTPRDDISRFLTGVSYIVKEDWRTTMLHGDVTLSRLMVYTKSNE